MVKVTLEVPEAVAELLKAMESKLQQEAQAAEEFAAVDPEGALKTIDAATDALSLESKRRLLQSYDTECERVRIDGRRHTRVGRYEASYQTLQGPVAVTRSLYREVGVRNGPTLDVVSARAGCVADGWLPEAAGAMGHLLACGTSREAEGTARALGRLPYSRSSFERVGHATANLYGAARAQVEPAMAETLAAPAGTASVSVSLDRVAVPMEEPRARPVGRPKRGAPQRPVQVVWRMAYVGCLTFHDKKGEALGSIRYGRMPQSGSEALARRLAEDVQAILLRVTGLSLVVLTDGAPELHALLDTALATYAPAAREVVRLVDFWHLIEKLAGAALVLVGAERSQRLIERWTLALLNRSGAVWQIATELNVSDKRGVRVGDRTPVHEAITYLENHGERMAYDEARAVGLPIGSGNVEATCKSLVALRMKRPGARWREASGQRVLDLRALVLSNRWNTAMELTLAPLRRSVQAAA